MEAVAAGESGEPIGGLGEPIRPLGKPQTRSAIGGQPGCSAARQRAGGHPAGDGRHPGRPRRCQSDRRRDDAQAFCQYPFRFRRRSEGERVGAGEDRKQGGVEPGMAPALRTPLRTASQSRPVWATTPARKASRQEESTTKSSMGSWPQSARVRFTRTPRRCIAR